MDICLDFLEWLGPDTSTSVLLLLDDPADLVRVSDVSRSWHRFAISNGFCKKLCLRMCLEVSCFKNVIEVKTKRVSSEVGSSTAMEWDMLEKEHRAYSYLSYCLVSPTGNRECLAEIVKSFENFLQSFKLPRPVICVGGILQIELLGRVQVQEMDGLYYICVCHVQAIGRPLSPIFDVKIREDTEDAVLKFFPESHDSTSLKTRNSPIWHSFRERFKHVKSKRGWNHRFLSALLGVSESDSDEEADH